MHATSHRPPLPDRNREPPNYLLSGCDYVKRLVERTTSALPFLSLLFGLLQSLTGYGAFSHSGDAAKGALRVFKNAISWAISV